MSVSLFITALSGTLPCTSMSPSAASTPWVHAGPGGYAMIDDPLKLESAGAAQAMVQVNGSASSSWLLATANGGIWKTADLHETPPVWRQVKATMQAKCAGACACHAMCMPCACHVHVHAHKGAQ